MGITEHKLVDLFKLKEKNIFRFYNFNIDFVISYEPPYECMIRCGLDGGFVLFRSFRCFRS